VQDGTANGAGEEMPRVVRTSFSKRQVAVTTRRALLRVLALMGPIFRWCGGQKPTTAEFRGQLVICDRRRLGALLLSRFIRHDQRYSAQLVIVEICNTPQNIQTAPFLTTELSLLKKLCPR